MKRFIKIPDIVIILLAAGITFFSAYTAYVKPQGVLRVLIRGQNSEWIFQLNSDETVIVSGPIGDTIIKINENSAWVESSPCENRNCVAAGYVSRQGQWAACLPNNVLLMIEGDTDIDAISW